MGRGMKASSTAANTISFPGKIKVFLRLKRKTPDDGLPDGAMGRSLTVCAEVETVKTLTLCDLPKDCRWPEPALAV
jgi:hypothetical protein